MATNNKNLPDIKGSETIASSWERLLTRDRAISNLFSGEAFTEDQDPAKDIGRPNWRTDLNRLFIYNGTNFVNLFNYLTPEEIKYIVDHPDIPEGVEDIKNVLDILVRRNNLNTVVMPTDGLVYVADGFSFEYNLARYESNKNTIMVFIDGVKQATDTYNLSESGESIIFEVAPAKGERVEIIENSSLLQYDYSPVAESFEGDGSNTDFVTSFEILNPVCVNVNIDGKVLQLSEYSLLENGYGVRLKSAPINGSKIQITTINKTSFVTVSPASIGTEELKDGSVTPEKITGSLPVDMNSIPTGGITNVMIANNSIDSSKLADDTVITGKIVNGAVTQEKLAESILKGLLGEKNVGNVNLADASVTLDKLGDDVKAQLGGTIDLSSYATKSYVNNLIGNIDSILDNINGEVV